MLVQAERNSVKGDLQWTTKKLTVFLVGKKEVEKSNSKNSMNSCMTKTGRKELSKRRQPVLNSTIGKSNSAPEKVR